MSGPTSHPPAQTAGRPGRGGKRGKVKSTPKGRTVDPKALEDVRALLGDAPGDIGGDATSDAAPRHREAARPAARIGETGDLFAAAASTTTPEAPPPDAEAVVLTEASYARLRNALSAYDCRQFDFRIWWVREYGKIRPANAFRYITRRETWNPTGGMKEWLCVRKAA